MLGLCVVGFEVLVAEWPGRRNAAVVSDFSEILFTKPQQGRSIHLRIATDVILNAGKERLAVLVIPRLIGPVLGFDKDSLGIPVVFLARQIPAPFEQQNSFARRRQMVSECPSAGSGSYDDDVVMIVWCHTSYPNTGASDIETRPRTKSVNISASRRLTSMLAPRNSFHTKTPQAAEIIVLPSLSENEVAGPTMGV